MKKVLLLAASAAMILTGCSKQFVDEATPDAQSGTVSFETYLSNATKGIVKNDFVTGDQFKVIGGNTGTSLFDPDVVSFKSWVFNAAAFPDHGATVSNYGGNPARWSYDNPVGWGTDNLTFFAFSPVPQGPETYGITYTSPVDEQTIPNIDFEVKGGYDLSEDITSTAAADSRPLTKRQVDLLWAATRDKKKADKVVPLAFKHALTRMSFAIKSNAPAGHMIRINTIALTNVAVKGNLALDHNQNSAPKPGDENYIGGWAIDATAPRKNFAINLVNNIASLIKDNDIHTITDNDEALMMIPQPLAGVELVVKYAYSQDGTNWENYEKGELVTVKLDDMYSHWNPNKQIRYVLNITPGEAINFTATIDPWGIEGDVDVRSFVAPAAAGVVATVTLAKDDMISVVSAGDWITMTDPAAATSTVTTTPVAATVGEYTFSVKANISDARHNRIVIDHVNGNRTVINVTQEAGNGAINAPANGGAVLTIPLKANDVIKVPQVKTKAAATWIKGNGVEISGDYTASVDENYVISVDANQGNTRSATIEVTLSSVTTTYTINQVGATVDPIAVNAIGGEVLTGAAGDKIELTDGGGTWFTITDNGGAATQVTGTITATGAYSLDAAANITDAARTASFTVTTSAGVTKIYELTQAAATVQSATSNAVGEEVVSSFTLADGDYVEALSGGADLVINDGSADNDLSSKVTVAGTYTIKAKTNTTAAEKTAQVVVAIGTSVNLYNVTQAAATVQSATSNAVGEEVVSSFTLADGDYVEALSGGADLVINDGATDVDLSSKVTGVGTYTIKAKTNTTAAEKTAQVVVAIGTSVNIYNVTVDAASEVTIQQIALDGTSSEVVALVAGDKILAGTDVSWLTLTSPATTQTYTGTEVVVTDAGNWTVAGSDNTSGAEVRNGSFTVVKADGSVVIYTVSQANA